MTLIFNCPVKVRTNIRVERRKLQPNVEHQRLEALYRRMHVGDTKNIFLVTRIIQYQHVELVCTPADGKKTGSNRLKSVRPVLQHQSTEDESS